jgi:hypothetical protein
MFRLLRFLLSLTLLGTCLLAQAELYIVSKSELTGMTERIAERLYTGKQFEFNGKSMSPVNYTAENPMRQKFLTLVVGKTEVEYTAYWATRRYVGLGTPPEEVKDKARMLTLLTNRDSAVGYIETSPEEASELRKRFSVLLVRINESTTKQ